MTEPQKSQFRGTVQPQITTLLTFALASIYNVDDADTREAVEAVADDVAETAALRVETMLGNSPVELKTRA